MGGDGFLVCVPLTTEQLLQWLNEFLETDYTKVESLKDGKKFQFGLHLHIDFCVSIGVAYAQIFDAVFPGKIPLSKINCIFFSFLEF